VTTPADDARAEAERRADEYETADDDTPDRRTRTSSRAAVEREGHRTEGDAAADRPGDANAKAGLGDRVKGVLGKADEVHRRSKWIAVPVAVFKKFGDDRGGNHAALIAYYGFFSLFPLLLAFTTILGFVVEDNEALRQRLLDTALANFPVIGNQIKVQSLDGSILALVIGILGALWAGMGVILTLQAAFDDVWDVPRRSRPNFLKGRLRALLALMAFGIGIGLAAALGALGGAGGSFGLVLRGVALVGTLALNGLLFAAMYRYLTVAPVTWKQSLPGAGLAAVGWMLLLALGSWFVSHQINGASQTYGTFAFVIGLLAWIALTAQLILLGAELNVVLARRLWPRALQPPPLTPADREVLAAQAHEEEARPSEDVDVTFEPPDAPATERHS
jgi:membrane protein